MTIRAWAMIGLATGCFAATAELPEKKPEVTKTERLEFPAGGTLRLEHSIGTLTVEGWDRRDMEITTSHPEKLQIAAERNGDEVVVTTDPRRSFIRHNPLIGGSNFDVEYNIKLPAGARLVVHHQVGQVNVDKLMSDIDVTLTQGEILLHLPQDGKYTIHARSDYGNVNSDFAGEEKRRRWFLGHRMQSGVPAAAHNLNLKVLSGDIVILKIQVPKEPAPLSLASTQRSGS
jgi:hypothetical protein